MSLPPLSQCLIASGDSNSNRNSNSNSSNSSNDGKIVDSNGDSCFQLLRQCLDVPSTANIQKGVFNLAQLQVVVTRPPPPPVPGVDTDVDTDRSAAYAYGYAASGGDSGVLTALGRKLAQFVCSPRVGRVVLYGVMFSSVYSACLLGAILSSSKGSPMLRGCQPSNQITGGQAVEDTFGAFPSFNSEHLMLYQLVVRFHLLGTNSHHTTSNNGSSSRQQSARGGSLFRARQKFCTDNNCMLDIMVEIVDALLFDLLTELQTMHFITMELKNKLYYGEILGKESVSFPCNRNAHKPKLLLALLKVGLYPNIAYVLKPGASFIETSNGSVRRATTSAEYK